MQSVFDHPLFVCRKGRRAADSMVPSVLRADIQPRVTRQGALVSGIVSLRNTGDTLWLRGDSAGPCPARNPAAQSGPRPPRQRFRPREPAFRRRRRIRRSRWASTSRCPTPPTPYILKFDLVDEGVCWFEDVGSRPGVRRGLDLAIDTHGGHGGRHGEHRAWMGKTACSDPCPHSLRDLRASLRVLVCVDSVCVTALRARAR